MSDQDFEPRKLPRQLRSQQTVDAIFEAAMQVLEKAEQSEPSVQSIADRASVSVGSLYQYFPTKQAMVRALIRFHLQQRMDALDRELEAARGLDGEQAAARLVEGLIGEKTVRMRIEHAMVRHFVRVGDLSTLTEFDERMYAAVQKFIEGVNGLRPADTSIASFLISNLLRSAVLLSIVQRPEQLTKPEFKAELTRMLVAYLKA